MKVQIWLFSYQNLKVRSVIQCSGSEINNFGSGSSNWKSEISDPDPSVTRDGEKKVVNFGYNEDTNGLKSWTSKIFLVLCMKLWWICSPFSTFLKHIFKFGVEKGKSGSEINNFGSGSLRPNNLGSGRIRNTGDISNYNRKVCASWQGVKISEDAWYYIFLNHPFCTYLVLKATLSSNSAHSYFTSKYSNTTDPYQEF